MSEQSQGPGWWLASDGKWYPPESVPAPPPPPLPTPLHEAQPQNGESGWWKRNWKWAVGLSIALSNANAQIEGGGPGTVGLNPLLVDGGNILLLWGLWEVGNRWWSRRKAREDE